MSLADDVKAPIRHADRFFIGGQWVQPSSDATIKVIDSGTEELFFSVAEAQAADISRAVEAAREAFDSGPWPRLTHAERAGILRAIGAQLSRRSDDIGQIWPRESGVPHAIARFGGAGAQVTFNAFADLVGTLAFEALAGTFSQVRVGDPFDAQTQMGPLVASRQRDRVEGYIAKGIADGFTLATGGGRPKDLDLGWFVEPTVFGNVDNSSVIVQEEIFGPVLSVIPAQDEQDAVRIPNDTIYGLNASVFTSDIDRARQVAGQLRSGTAVHNAFRTHFSVSFGGFKQSGIGREGLLPFLETKFVILEGRPAGYENTEL